MYTQETYKILITFILFAVFLAAFALPFVSGIRINEVMYDLNGSDTGREWIEVYNDGSESINLTAWKFYENNQKHNLNLTSGSWIIEVEAYFVIADNSASFLADNPSFNTTLFDSSFSLSNTGESIALWNGSEYFSNTTYSSSSGAAGDGKSLQFIDSVWQACLPTPGYLNSCQSQSQNQSSNETQNTTQQNQTSQANQTQQNQTATQNQSIATAVLYYSNETAAGKNITVELYAYNLDNSTYDVKLAAYDGGSIISETYNENEAKWKSSTYYINSVFSGTSIRKNFTLSIRDAEFRGYANISVKLRKSGTSSIYIEYSGRIKIVESENINESIIRINSGEETSNSESANEEEVNETGVIRLNKPSSTNNDEGNILFTSKTEKIKRYAIYGFAVFLVLLIIVLFKYRRI